MNLYKQLRRWPRLAGLLLSTLAAPVLAQDIELYDQPRFGGTRLTLSSDAADLAGYSFGGRIASVVVRNGVWEFCTQAQFRGACITVGPGRYAELPPALRGTLMSVRTAGLQWSGVAALPVPQPYPTTTEPVVLHENADFTGQRLALSAASKRLSNQAFNDTAMAVEIWRGRWQFCEHSDFAGECIVLGPGRHVLTGRMQQSVSSVRPVAGHDSRPLHVFGGVVLYEHSDHQGREQMANEATPHLAQRDFNDKTSSVEVLGGRWELCTEADYGGRCIVLGVGRYNIERSLNDRISSVRPR